MASSRGLRLLTRPLLIMTGLAVLLWLAPPAGLLVYVGLALYAARGPRHTIEALTLLILALLGNPIVNAEGGSILRWFVLAAGFGRLIWDSVFQDHVIEIPLGPIAILSVFSVMSIVFAVLVSVLPTVAILKVLTFSVGVSTILICFYSTRHLSTYWRAWFYTFFVFSIGASIVVLIAGVGYLRTQEGFQGVFSHPQIFGPIAGIIGVWLTGRFILSDDKPHLVLLATIGMAWVFVLLSGSRTAAFAALGGALLAGGSLFMSRVRKPFWDFLLSPRLAVLAFLLIGATVTFAPELSTIFSDFIQKERAGSAVSLRSESTNILQESRGALMERSMANFYESPWVGIGFGVPSDPRALGSVETVGGIPVSATVEKGFMPTAMLEEVGIIGTGFVLFFLGLISISVVRWGGMPINWMYWTALLINGGAAIFFSVGGLGLVMWMVIGFCYAQAESCKEYRVTKSANIPRS